jgi:RHS repeat-associated protein
MGIRGLGNVINTFTFSYDQRDRMVEVYPDLKMRVQYGYDLAGRMNSLSYPGGETVRYERDRAGRVTVVVDSVAGRTEMGYDLLGRQVSQRWPNGLSETRTYDSASRLLAITPGQQDKKDAPTITYTYDQRGNRLTMDRSDVGLSRYTYDEISQLLTAALPDGDFQTYRFDAVGNRLSLEDSRGLQAYEYDEADELLEVESDFNPEQPSMIGPLMTRLGASDASKPLFRTTYGWDADGNQVSKNGPGNKTSRYTFDSLDRLTAISAPGSEPEKYLYNADRQRIATVRGKDSSGTVSVAERFLHLGRGRQVLGDLDGNGRLTKRYILLPSGQLLAHVDTSANRPAFYHFDALGSTVVMSDSANRITAKFVYDPYGARRSTPEAEERYGVVGFEGVEESSSGIVVMGVRAYDYVLGRFTSKDPLGLPESLFARSSYAYARNNPVLYRDPEGLLEYSSSIPMDQRVYDETWRKTVCVENCYGKGLKITSAKRSVGTQKDPGPDCHTRGRAVDLGYGSNQSIIGKEGQDRLLQCASNCGFGSALVEDDARCNIHLSLDPGVTHGPRGDLPPPEPPYNPYWKL